MVSDVRRPFVELSQHDALPHLRLLVLVLPAFDVQRLLHEGARVDHNPRLEDHTLLYFTGERQIYEITITTEEPIP